MLRTLSRGCLGALLVLQPASPALAWNWYVVDEPCCCEVAWDCCEEVIVADKSCGCEAVAAVVDDCGCGSEATETQTTDESKEPTAAESKKPETPSVETEQPTLDSNEELPPAPINVPSTPAADSVTDDFFPGPAAEPTPPAETTPTEVVPSAGTPSAEPAADADDPFGAADTAPELSVEEPAAESGPADIETESAESVEIDDVFGEPAPSAAESVPVTEEETLEEESTEESAPATDPLDDLFGPSSAIEPPQPNEKAIGANRLWTTRGETGHYEGRLVRMTTAGVFVLQPNGKLVALAFSELSDADLRFVRNQVQLERDLLATQGDEMQLAVRNSQ